MTDLTSKVRAAIEAAPDADAAARAALEVVAEWIDAYRLSDNNRGLPGPITAVGMVAMLLRAAAKDDTP